MAPAESNGSHLAERVLEAPEHGAGYFFPATAEGTALIAVSLAVVLGLLSVGNAKWIPAAASGIVTPVALSVGAVGITIGGSGTSVPAVSSAAHSGSCTGRSGSRFGLLTQISAAGLIKAAGQSISARRSGLS